MRKRNINIGEVNTIAMMLMLLGVLVAACEPAPDLFQSFTIKKGEHYADVRFPEALQQNTLSFQAIFDNSAQYDLGDECLQTNKNKLFGFSDCNSMHHENSARFAWQWFNGQLEIYAYCYVNGGRTEKFIGTVPLNTPSNYRIEVSGSSYSFYLNNYPPVTIARGNVCDRGVYYMLWPYFGGSVPAPHDVTIKIKKLF
ncbi:MAG TPA: hypothetical protein VD927_13435 [Chryseosolibacter sp.]|nr:hypothetical protein [Chryseosolibacter sp.]